MIARGDAVDHALDSLDKPSASTAVGFKLDLAAELVRDPEVVKTAILGGGAQTYAAGLIDKLTQHPRCLACRCSGAHLGWYRHFAKVAGLSGTSDKLLRALLDRLGMRTEQELASRLLSVNRVSDLSEDEIAASAVEWLRTRGWTCLEPGKGVHENGNGNGAAVG